MKRRFGKRAFAAFMSAAMILSASTEIAFAKANSVTDQSAISEVSDASSVSAASTEQSQGGASIVAEGSALTTVRVPTGLKGTGSAADPYKIGNIDDLLLMNSYINYEGFSSKYFEMTADIDLSELIFPALNDKDFGKKSDFHETEGIYSVVSCIPSLSGNSNVSFHLNGKGHTFYNMHISVPDGVRVAGLFGYVSANSSIENVNFYDCSMRVDNNSTGAYALLAVQNHGVIRDVTISEGSVDFRSGRLIDDGNPFVKLACGKVYKGVSLVAADNNGSISGVTVQSGDIDHGIFVRDAVQYIGAVAGQNRKTISDCKFSGVRILSFGSRAADGYISGDGVVAKYVGAIVGSNNSFIARKPASVSGCSVEFTHGSDLMYGDYVGGIAGLNAGSVTGCTVSGSTVLSDAAPAASTAEIVGTGHFGGLVGLNNGTVSESGAYDLGFGFAGVSANNVYGGLVSENNGTITACAASGYVHTNGDEAAAVGGIVGYAAAGSTLSNTYSFVSISKETDCSGAIAGRNASLASVEDHNFWIPTTYGFSSAIPDPGVTVNALQCVSPVLSVSSGAEGTSFASAALAHSWENSRASVTVDFFHSITVDDPVIRVTKASSSFTLSSKSGSGTGNVTYYIHVSLPSHTGTRKSILARVSVPVLVAGLASKGAGESAANPIVISNYEQFRYIESNPDAHYRLAEDITVGSDWTSVVFGGTLDGAGHTIRTSSGLFSGVVGNRDSDLNDSNWKNGTANMQAGVIRNLTVDAVGAVYGGLFGSIENATLDHVTFMTSGDGFVVLSAAQAGAMADVVVGNAYLHNCYSSVPITVVSTSSDGIGALVGKVAGRTFVMDNCGSSSTIAVDGHALSKVGGLIGFAESASRARISNCYASGSVYTKPKSDSAGARIGVGSVSAYAKSNLVVEHCYYSVAEPSLAGCTVAREAIQAGISGFRSLAEYEDTYSVDPNGEETQIVFVLPQELDACRDVQASDIVVEVEQDESFAVLSTDVSGTEVTVGVTAQDDVARDANSELTITHEPTGLQITNTIIPDVGLTLNGGYYEIYSVSDLNEIASNWGTYSGAKLKLCADISVGSGGVNGSLNSFPATSSAPFTGEFIGAAKASGVYTISYANLSGQALFPYSDGATFSNFGLDHISVNSSAVGVAVLVGHADESTNNSTEFSNITISNCSVVSTASGYDPGSNPVDITDSNTVQVGSLAGSIGTIGTNESPITGIKVYNTSVTNTNDNAYAVGGLIGLVYGHKDSSVAIGTSTSISDSFSYGGSSVTLSGSIIMCNVTVTGYGSVGGVLGMAGQFPQDADSTNELSYIDANPMYDGALSITNAVVYGSSITAGNSSNSTGGACGGIIGSEVVGEYENYDADFFLSDSKVQHSTIIAYAHPQTQISYNSACGGIAGYSGGTISQCSVSDSTIRSATAGGIVGRPARKDYYYPDACKLMVNGCSVYGASVISSVSGSASNALSLGGIAASAVNCGLALSSCSVGASVQISGNALHVGGLIGYVYSFEDENDGVAADGASAFACENGVLGMHDIYVQQCVCAATVANTASNTTSSAVGGVLGYAQIVETALTINNNALAGSYSNSESNGYCAGVLGHFVTTYEVADTNGIGNKADFVKDCTVAASVNASGVTSGTAKLIARFDCGAWISQTPSMFAQAITGNLVSGYMQTCSAFGQYTVPGSRSSAQSLTTISYSANSYADIDKPNGNYSNGTTDATIKKITGTTPTTVTLSNLTAYAATTNTTRLKYSLTTDYWYSDDDDVLTVNSVASGPVLTVAGVSNSSNAVVIGALDVRGFTLPDDNESVKILVHVPLICTGIQPAVAFTARQVDGLTFYEVPDFQHLDALHNATNVTTTNTTFTTLTSNFIVTADITVSSNFEPIGSSSSSPYTGKFHSAANGSTYYKISAMNYTGDAASAGLFGYTSGASFVNVILENADIETTGARAGALVGTASSTTFTNVKLLKSGSADKTVSASDYAGALAAYVEDCTVNGVEVNGYTIEDAAFCGGLFGYSAVASGSNSIANATVSAVTVTSSSSNYSDIAAGLAAKFSGSTSGTNTVSGAEISGSTASGAIGSVLANSTVANITINNTTTVESTNPNSSSKAAGIVAVHSVGTLAVSGCRSNAEVTSRGSTGGMVASTSNLVGLTVDHAIVCGTLSGSSAVGGLVGSATGSAAANAFSNTVFSATLSGSATAKGAAFGTCDVQSTAPVCNFYVSSYQYNSVKPALTGSGAFTDPATYFDMQSSLVYTNAQSEHVIRYVTKSSSTGTLNSAYFSFTGITASGTYNNFSASSSVPFVLSAVTPSVSGLFTAFNVSTGTFSGMDDGAGKAQFVFENGIVVGIDFVASSISGSGQQGDPFLIEKPKDLKHLYDSDKLTGCFAITADLDLTDYDSDPSTSDASRWITEVWKSADWQSLPFTGTLTGTYNSVKHTISNLTITDATLSGLSATSIGFFPVFKGTLSDVVFSNCSVSVTATDSDVGTVAGRLSAYKVNSTTSCGSISGVTVSGTVSGSSSNATVSGDRHVGGLVGVSFGTVTNCTMQNVYVSASHCAGGVIGGGVLASGCSVTGCDIHSNQFAGGIIGGTLSFIDEIYYDYLTSTEGWTQNDACSYLNRNNAVVTQCSVSGSTKIYSVPTASATAYCVGGIIGICEEGINSAYRYCTISNCSIDAADTAESSRSEIKADKLDNPSASQFGYAGGIVGYLAERDSCNIHHCAMYGTVKAYGTAVVASGGNSVENETSAGGLIGSTALSVYQRFHETVNGTDYYFAMNRNIINGSVTSSSYAGGLIGRLVSFSDDSSNVITSGDEFICYNIIAPTFTAEGGISHVGILTGRFLPDGEFRIGTYTYTPAVTKVFTASGLVASTVYANYYSSFVSGTGIAVCGVGSCVSSCVAHDVAKDTDNTTSFKVKNDGDTEYTNAIDGQKAVGTYTIPFQIRFGTHDNTNHPGNLSLTDSTFAIDTRTLSLTAADFSLRDAGSFFTSSYTTVTEGDGAHHGSSFTIVSPSDTTAYLVADLGFGLKIGVGITSHTGSGTPQDPYTIGSAAKFVDYFFTRPNAIGNTENYFNKYYKQIADIDFDEIDALLTSSGGFAPVGSELNSFTGGYDGNGKRIYDFSFNDAAQSAVGLFGHVSDAAQANDDLYTEPNTPRLQNLHIELKDNGVNGGMYTGGLVGHYSSVHPIRNCSVVYGSVTANRMGSASTDFAHAGGLIGYSGSVTLDGCFTSTDVRCGLGGATAGTNAGQFYHPASSDWTQYSAGGLIGYVKGSTASATLTFNRCFSSSDVVGSFFVGGFVGRVESVAVAVTDGISTATVSSLRHMTQESDSDWVDETRPVSLVIGYLTNASASVIDGSGSMNLTVNNLVVAGLNTTEYARRSTESGTSLTYASLFGMFSASSSSTNVYYDAQVTGRITVPSGTNYYVKKPNGSLYTSNGTASATASGICVPTNKTTVELLQLTPSDLGATGTGDASAWLTADQNGSLYPVLNLYDAYSKAYAKLSSLPAFADPREANDADTGERSYRGLTYPVAIDDAILGVPIAISASDKSARNDSSTSYDASIYGGYTVSGTGDSATYTAISSKNFDLLFKKNASQYLVIRNSYLDYGSTKKLTNFVRDVKSPSVYLNTTVDGIAMHRTVRIPLRGEQNTVYVATERQLRAIMGSQNGSESNNRFYDAYHEVIQTNNQGKNVKICADIDLSSANFTPISGYQLNVAASDNDLSCGFDGSNCAITGMRINQPGSDNVGMFSLVGNTSASVKIQNIILCDVSVTGQDYVGALIGRAGSSNDVYDKAMVVNCKVITSTEGESTVTGRNYVGGLIGYANGVSLNHKKTNSAPERVDGVCGSNATVLSTGYCVGGLIGKMDHVKVYNCYATGEVALQSTDPIAGQLSAGFGNQAVGGFVGTVGTGSEIEHAFAFGNVSATVQRVGGAATSFGVGGFAGSSQIAISDCFSSGDVACSVSNYYTNENSLRHGIGGLVGLTTAAVSNSYSSSAVSLTCDSPGTIGSLTTIGVGGVVGYSYSTVTNVYSSGNVSAPITNGGSSQNWIGGAAGFVSSTASHAYFDTWTNADSSLKAVGNKDDSTNNLCGFTTDQFCNGSLITSGCLPSAQWGYDQQTGVTSNAYPYLKSFFTGDVSDYVKFPAVLSIVAVRPNDRDSSARDGHGYSMAVTMPSSVHVEGVTYDLAWTSGSSFGHTYAPARTSNGQEDVALQVWVNSYTPDGENARVYTGYYDLAAKDLNDPDVKLVSNKTENLLDNEVSFAEVLMLARDTFTPHVGQYVKLTQGYQGYGVRTIHRLFQMMLGTDKYPFLISSVDELKSIFFENGYTVPAQNTKYYHRWYSQLEPQGGGLFANVQTVSSSQYGTVGDKVVHYKLMINIDMTDKTFTSIGTMSGFTHAGIPFNGFELDGNDYAIVNFTSSAPFITQLDSTSTVKNLIFEDAEITGSGDRALVGTNNGTIDGLMLTEKDGSSITATGGNAAGLVVVNNGTISNSVAQGTITGGGADKYIGGIAAKNNGTIETSVSAAELTAGANTLGIGGLVGQNASGHSVTDCFTLGSVEGVATSYTGGLVGENSGTVSYSYSRAEVTGTADKTGSFAGRNVVGSSAGTINDAFAAGKLTIASANSGSAFVGKNKDDVEVNNEITTVEGTLTRAYADKALLGSGTYKLLGDAEVTENIRGAVCFNNTSPNDHYVLSGGSVTVTIDNTDVSLTNPTAGGYPQLKSVYALKLNETETYSIGGGTQSYTAMKAQLLYAYSILASVTADTVAANYVDRIPTGTTNPLTTVSETGYTVKIKAGENDPVAATQIVYAAATSGKVVATSAQLSQKTGAGSNVADDLKYTLVFPFDFAVVGGNANPNFASGNGTAAASAYAIDTSDAFESLVYFGKATDAYFQMTSDVSFDGNELTYPITKFCGHLDGDSYTVNDLDITDQPGIFGKIEDNAEVKNLGLVGIELTATPTADMLNFGLLAGESGAATVQNVYAVGKITVADASSSVNSAANVGGLIGWANGTTVVGVVTSGELRNNHAVSGSAAGGVIGSMTNGQLGGTVSGTAYAALSTAYVSGTTYAGGIVGNAAGTASITNAIFAGQADGTTKSHILANNGGTGTVTNVRYDKQIMPLPDESSAYGATSHAGTWTLANVNSNGFTKTDANKYYSTPVTVPSSGHTAFKAGLYFATARITASIAGGEGSVDAYDTIKVTSPLDSSASDTVTLAISLANPNNWVDGNNTNVLTPKGDGTNPSTAITATLNTASGSTFANNVNAVTRYVNAKIPQLVQVNYEIVDKTTNTSFGNNTQMELSICPDLNGLTSVASNAITNIAKTVDSAAVAFQDVVLLGDHIDVDAILPAGYTFKVNTNNSDSTYLAGNSIPKQGNVVQNQETGAYQVTVYVHVYDADPTWGLQELNGTVTQ